MLTKIIGAMVGARLAKNTPKVSGPAGAALGAVVPVVLSRLSLPGMLALAAGGYVAKRYMDKQGSGTPPRRLMPPASKPVAVTSDMHD